MKQITEDACQAFNAGYNFTRSNTEVLVSMADEGKRVVSLFLHGNLIAMKNWRGLHVTTAGWNTLTTRERLNGLHGVHVYKRRGQLYLNGEKWDGEMKLI